MATFPPPAIGPEMEHKRQSTAFLILFVYRSFSDRTPYARATARPFLLFILCLHLHLSHISSQIIRFPSTYCLSNEPFPPHIKTVFSHRIVVLSVACRVFIIISISCCPFSQKHPSSHFHILSTIETHIHLHTLTQNIKRPTWWGGYGKGRDTFCRLWHFYFMLDADLILCIILLPKLTLGQREDKIVWCRQAHAPFTHLSANNIKTYQVRINT